MRSNLVDARRSPNMESQYSGPAFVPPGPDHQIARSTYHFSSSVRRSSFIRKRHLPAPTEGWLVMLLLAVALYCVVYSIMVANWVDHSVLLIWIPPIGLLVGFLIAKAPRFPQSLLHIAACLLGHWVAVWLTSVVAFHISWLQLLLGLRAAFTNQLYADTFLDSRIIFFFYLTFLCFFLGYFGSWLVYRAHLPWLVALVYFSILLVNLNYIPHNLSYLVVIMLAALILLIARMQLVAQILQWTSEGLHTDRVWLSNIYRRCMQAACVIAAGAVLIGAVLPALDQPASGKVFWNQLDNAWSNIVNGRVSWQNLSNLTEPDASSTNFFSDQLTITNSIQLPNEQVLYYTSSDGKSHYLQGFTYDQFDGHTWHSPAAQGSLYGPGITLPPDTRDANFSQVTSTITLVKPPQGSRNYIFAPALPTSFNVGTIVYSDSTTTAWTQTTPLTVNESYKVISAVPSTDTQSFSTIPLPQQNKQLWQVQHTNAYLETPGDLSPQVQAVAQQWTRGATNAYEAMQMLAAHLSNSSQFKYSVSNPPIPANEDVVDWLLQNRVGYCTYYATAMAMMGRLLGMPTRVVNGFSQGHYDSQKQVWSVTGEDAHSWVQVYFPGHGWISFDPTPGYSISNAQSTQTTPKPTPTPVVVHPTPTPKKSNQPVPTAQTTPHTGNKKQVAKQTPFANNQVILLFIALAVLLLALLFFCYACALSWWRRMYASSSPVAGMFWRICRVASWAGLAPGKWQTPYEYSGMLNQHFPLRATPFSQLTELFVQDRWGTPQQLPDAFDETTVEQLWPSLRVLLVRLFLSKVKKT